VQLVRLYDVSFSVRQAPYLVSYATYVAATIHVRLASSSPPDSAAHESLAVCLTVLDLNSKTNPAVRKASVVIEALMKAMNVNMEKPQDSNGNASSAIQRDSRMNNGTSTGNSSSTQHHDRLGPDQASRSGSVAALTQQPYARGTMAPYSQQQNNNVQQPNIMVPADVADGSTYAVEPGSEYFGDFAFDGMDDILFGFNASESIFQDFM
jgi:hypothetical protein